MVLISGLPKKSGWGIIWILDVGGVFCGFSDSYEFEFFCHLSGFFRPEILPGRVDGMIYSYTLHISTYIYIYLDIPIHLDISKI